MALKAGNSASLQLRWRSFYLPGDGSRRISACKGDGLVVGRWPLFALPYNEVMKFLRLFSLDYKNRIPKLSYGW